MISTQSFRAWGFSTMTPRSLQSSDCLAGWECWRAWRGWRGDFVRLSRLRPPTKIQLRLDYDDAMADMNLMYRERADLECTDLAARDQDLKTADEWVDKAMAARKANANKA